MQWGMSKGMSHTVVHAFERPFNDLYFMFSCIRRATGDLVSFIPYTDIETDSTYIVVTHHNQSLPFPITIIYVMYAEKL